MYYVKALTWGFALFLLLYIISSTYLSFSEVVLSVAVGSLAYMQVSDDPKKKVKADADTK